MPRDQPLTFDEMETRLKYALAHYVLWLFLSDLKERKTVKQITQEVYNEYIAENPYTLLQLNDLMELTETLHSANYDHFEDELDQEKFK